MGVFPWKYFHEDCFVWKPYMSMSVLSLGVGGSVATLLFVPRHSTGTAPLQIPVLSLDWRVRFRFVSFFTFTFSFTFFAIIFRYVLFSLFFDRIPLRAKSVKNQVLRFLFLPVLFGFLRDEAFCFLSVFGCVALCVHLLLFPRSVAWEYELRGSEFKSTRLHQEAKSFITTTDNAKWINVHQRTSLADSQLGG
jgi:hypothetical protein